jgi:hypothetical protein
MKNLLILLLFISTTLFGQVLPTPSGNGQQDDSDVTLGMVFKPKQKSIVTGLRYYCTSDFIGLTTGHLWDNNGKMLATGVFLKGPGWIDLNFPNPILVDSGKTYTSSFSNDGGYYISTPFFFPREYQLFTAVSGTYTYFKNSYPTLIYQQSNYSIEPILKKYVEPVLPNPLVTLIRDTVYLIRDTCSIDYNKLVDLTFVLLIQERGGTVMLPDSTLVYSAVFGAAQPHERLKDDLSLIIYRFQRNYVIQGVSTPVRFTMYKTGAWRRELKDSLGVWRNYPFKQY